MKSMPQIGLVQTTGGEWEQLWVNGELFAAGHKITTYDWLDAFTKLGIKIGIREVSDESMEGNEYNYINEE